MYHSTIKPRLQYVRALQSKANLACLRLYEVSRAAEFFNFLVLLASSDVECAINAIVDSLNQNTRFLVKNNCNPTGKEAIDVIATARRMKFIQQAAARFETTKFRSFELGYCKFRRAYIMLFKLQTKKKTKLYHKYETKIASGGK